MKAQKKHHPNGSLLFLLCLLVQMTSVYAQSQIYDNFEGSKVLHYGERSGVLDTLMKNPLINSVDSTKHCALYVRNVAKKFDNIKMSFNGKLSDVSPYATYTGIPPKITMKIYTTAPPGTLIEILLGSKGRNNEYPAGTSSQYQAYTTVSNTWEIVQFKFSQIPQGSETSTTQIDQMTLLFNPNSLTSETYYFDDISGPLLISSGSEPVVAPVQGAKNPVPIGKQGSKKIK